jgi:hypothetical protein
MRKPADWRVAKSIFVADDDKVATRYGYGADGPYHFYFKQLIRKLVGFGGARTCSSWTRTSPTARSPRTT